jgi:hypothetical protein
MPLILIPGNPPFTNPKRVFVKMSIYTLDNAISDMDTCKMKTDIAVCELLQGLTTVTRNFAYTPSFGEIGEGKVGV